MAEPIELGLVLEGEDAEEFLEDIRNPKATLHSRLRCSSKPSGFIKSTRSKFSWPISLRKIFPSFL